MVLWTASFAHEYFGSPCDVQAAVVLAQAMGKGHRIIGKICLSEADRRVWGKPRSDDIRPEKDRYQSPGTVFVLDVLTPIPLGAVGTAAVLVVWWFLGSVWTAL